MSVQTVLNIFNSLISAIKGLRAAFADVKGAAAPKDVEPDGGSPDPGSAPASKWSLLKHMFDTVIALLKDAPRLLRYLAAATILGTLLLITWAVVGLTPMSLQPFANLRSDACFWGDDSGTFRKNIKKLGGFLCSEPYLLGRWYYHAMVGGTELGGLADISRAEGATNLYRVSGVRLWTQRGDEPPSCIEKDGKKWESELWSLNQNGFLFYYRLIFDSGIQGVMRLHRDRRVEGFYEGVFYDEITCSPQTARQFKQCGEAINSKDPHAQRVEYILEKGKIEYFREMKEDKCKTQTASK